MKQNVTNQPTQKAARLISDVLADCVSTAIMHQNN